MSAKELNIGDYVRTIYGIKKITDIICGQDIRFDNTDGFDEDLLKYHDYDGISKNSHTWEEIVIGKPSKNPIDLIEVGDYVNGYLVTDVYKPDGDEVFRIEIERDTLKGHIIDKSSQIKSIVTKEQFESMEYKIGK
jgi:hypothetical protein